MFRESLLLNFYVIKFIFFIVLIFTFFSLSNSASITTLSSSTYHHFELISNNSYRHFFLRQYFIDLINISHSSLIQSMIKNHHLTPKLEEIKNRRRRQFPLPPLFTLHSTNCLIINLHQIRTTFQWSHSIESLSSIELIYHINSKESLISIHLSIKQSQTLIELFSINIYLKYDSIREFYFVNLYDYFLQINNENLIIEIILNNQTCQTSYGYLIISSLKSNQIFSNDPQQITKCKLKTIQIKFEELGLADLIIRPKEYPFTYCDGSCLNFLSQQHSSIHTFLQSIIRKKNSNIPQLNCVPSQYSDDNFLLRQTDGNMEIYPIKNAIVKQCACL